MAQGTHKGKLNSKDESRQGSSGDMWRDFSRDFPNLLTARFGLQMGKVEDQIILVLEKSRKPMSLVEIADQIGKPPKTVFKSLRKLFEKGKIYCDTKNRQYVLVKE